MTAFTSAGDGTHWPIIAQKFDPLRLRSIAGRRSGSGASGDGSRQSFIAIKLRR